MTGMRRQDFSMSSSPSSSSSWGGLDDGEDGAARKNSLSWTRLSVNSPSDGAKLSTSMVACLGGGGHDMMAISKEVVGLGVVT